MPAILSNGYRAVKADLSDAAEWRRLFGLDGGSAPPSIAELYRRVPVVRRCADIRARACAAVPWGIYADGGKEPLWTDLDASEPPDRFAFLRGWDTHRYRQALSVVLTGAAYNLKLRDGKGPAGFQYLDPHTIEPKYNVRGLGVESFKRKINRTDGGYREEVLSVDDVLYVWEYDPWTEIGPGSSDGECARTAAAVVDALASFADMHLRRGAVRGHLVRVPPGTQPAERERVQDWIERKLTGKNKAPMTVVNADAFDLQEYGEKLSELTDTEMSDDVRRAVADAFGVPFEMIDGDANNYATASVFESFFFENKALPDAERLFESWNEQVLAPLNLAVYAEPERAPSRMMRQLEMGDKIKDLTGRAVLTVEEGRLMMGYPDEPEAGELFIPEPPVVAGPPDRKPRAGSAREQAEKALLARYGQVPGWTA